MAHYKSEHEAQIEADALIAKMHTEGWDKRVWDNPDDCWHFSIHCEGLSLCDTASAGGVFPMLSNHQNMPNTGETFYQLDGMASHTTLFVDPNEAVAAQLKKAEEHIALCRKTVDDIKKRLKLEESVTLY